LHKTESVPTNQQTAGGSKALCRNPFVTENKPGFQAFIGSRRSTA